MAEFVETFGSGAQISQAAAPITLKFPWHYSQTWTFTQGFYGFSHTGPTAVDFAPPAGTSADLYAPVDSKVVVICQGAATNNIKLEYSGGQTSFAHLNASLNVANKQMVLQGRNIGTFYNGTYGQGWYKRISTGKYESCTPIPGTLPSYGKCDSNSCCYYKYRDNCGIGTGLHVHWDLPSSNATVDEWTVKLNGTTTYWEKPGEAPRYVWANFGSSNGIRIQVDSPAYDDPVAGQIRFSGWALDPNATTSPGVSWVKLCFGGKIGEPGVECHDAVLGDERKDVGDAFGRQYDTSGWHLDYNVSQLGQGEKTVYLHANDNRVYLAHRFVSSDAAPPHTNHEIIGTAGANGWYRSAIQVKLNAMDSSAGISELYYRYYPVSTTPTSWSIVANSQVQFPITNDGSYAIEYYAKDGAGNIEAPPQTLQVKIDSTPPSVPGSIAETHGVVSGQWQRDISDPAFVWIPATDAGSGVDYYYVVGWPFRGGLSHSASFDPSAVRTGSYTFEVFAFDKAGNEGPRRSFTFNYDGDSPPAPGIENLDGVASGVWQNQVRSANFQWQTPVDAGSGVKGYYRYWGADANGTGDALVTGNTFSSPAPFCPEADACTYHLRVRTEDNVGWQSDWANFIMRYDGAPPTAEMVANYGLPVAHQTQVHLAVSAIDLGSGVTQMRLSNGGYAWSDWRPLAEELYWEIPAIGRRNHDIYLQVTDAAGNLSSIISDTVYFDVNAPYPSSESFQLWQSLTPAGAGIVSDTLHTMRVTVGQSSAAEAVQSTHYLLNPGFQAAALAIPTQTVTYTTYSQIGSLFASATNTATALASAHHRLYGSLGQPSDMRTVTSTNFIADLGFWAGAAHDLIPQPPEPPEPPVPPECEFYSLSVNNGALFTNSPLVTLNLCGPDPLQTMVSNDGGFSGAIWQPYTRAISWTLTTYGNTILPRFVYARYKDSQGYIHGNFMDDIIYDPNAPQGIAAFNPADLPDIGVMQRGDTALLMALGRPRTPRVVTEPQAQLYLSARDDSSGLAAMQVSATPDFDGATWEPYQAIAPISFEGEGIHTIYVRTRDAAGNISGAFSDQIIVDLTPPVIPPTGTVEVLEDVVGTGALTVTLAISATDAIGIHEARVSLSEAFTDTLWAPYSPTLVVPIRFTGELTPTLYVQLRDAAGNASAIYTTTYLVDVMPPYGTVEITALDGTLATLQLTAEDNLSQVTRLWLSADFWFFEDVTVRTYEESITWDFGDSDALYIMFEDAVGNRSWPYWVGPELFEQPGFSVFLPLVLRQQ